MVKGRKVRALVACARTDDCCSPHPKRRDRHVSNGPLLNGKNSRTITEFFESTELKSSTTSIIIDLNYGSLERSDQNGQLTATDLIETPQKQQTDNDDDDNVFQKPSTPHRIELCQDTVLVKEKLQIKSRKKLMEGTKTTTEINHKLTEYFPVRRSIRKTKKTVLEEKQRSLENLLRNQTEEGLEVRIFNDKGRGVVASRPFCKGDFVVEYSGDLIDTAEAKRRESKYALDKSTGCYMYYFKHNEQQYCVDATSESGKLGRLVNHSRNGNLLTRSVSVDNKPRLVLIAKDDIKEGDEITYDYGDRSKESLKHHPWLAY